MIQHKEEPIEPPPEVPNYQFGTFGYDFERADRSSAFAVTTGSLDEPAAFPPETSSWEEDRLPWDTPFDKVDDSVHASYNFAAGDG